MKDYSLSSIADLNKFSKEVFSYDANVFLLRGDLGAGKTTFVGSFIKENLLQKDEDFNSLGVMSPTYSLINSYQTKSTAIVHADLYRLNKNDYEKDELLELIEEADYSFIEWPSRIEDFDESCRNYKTIDLEFKITSDKIRTVTLKQL